MGRTLMSMAVMEISLGSNEQTCFSRAGQTWNEFVEPPTVS